MCRCCMQSGVSLTLTTQRLEVRRELGDTKNKLTIGIATVRAKIQWYVKVVPGTDPSQKSEKPFP